MSVQELLVSMTKSGLHHLVEYSDNQNEADQVEQGKKVSQIAPQVRLLQVPLQNLGPGPEHGVPKDLKVSILK